MKETDVFCGENRDIKLSFSGTGCSDSLSSATIRDKTARKHETITHGGAMIMESPILGHGVGAMQRMSEGNGLGVHNTFLMVQGEVGIVGSFLLFLFLFKTFNRSLRIADPNIRRFVLAYLFVFLSMMFFEHGGLTNRNHNYYLGVVIAIISITGTRTRRDNVLG